MSNEEETGKPDEKVENNEAEVKETQPSQDTKEEISEEDFTKLEKELNMANETLVSKEVSDQLKQAKEEARKEAEKEFATNQRIKELEEAVKKREEEKIELQKKTAEQLNSFKEQLDKVAASRAVVKTDSPFDKKEEPEEKKSSLTDDEAEEIQKASFNAMLDRK